MDAFWKFRFFHVWLGLDNSSCLSKSRNAKLFFIIKNILGRQKNVEFYEERARIIFVLFWEKFDKVLWRKPKVSRFSKFFAVNLFKSKPNLKTKNIGVFPIKFYISLCVQNIFLIFSWFAVYIQLPIRRIVRPMNCPDPSKHGKIEIFKMRPIGLIFWEFLSWNLP